VLKRLALWLCRVAGVPATETIDQTRLRGGNDAVERGQRWEAFYRERGGLADMLADLRREAFEAAAELDPKDTDKIYYWATADRNIRRLQQKVEAIVITGKSELANREQLERDAKLRIIRNEF
jgi:hypothetical protein